MPTDEEKVFVVDADEISSCSMELDVDIDYQPCPKHFRLYSRMDTSVGDCEYEYKIEGTEVFVRLFQDRSRNAGEPEHWDVLDGVVQESAIREREEKKNKAIKRIGRSADEEIEDLRKATEWTCLRPVAWRGFVYFVLACSLPRSDARRYFRQELERLTRSDKLFIEAAAKRGYEAEVDGSGRRNLRFAKGQEQRSDAEKEAVDLPGMLEKAGLTYEEFLNVPILAAQLRQLLEEKRESAAAKKDSTDKKSKRSALIVKGISWLILTVFFAGYYALALMLMWNWFVAEGLHLPTLSFVGALGIIWTISLIRRENDEAVFTNKRWDLLFSVLEYCVPENRAGMLRDAIKEKTEGVWSELTGLAFGQALTITLTLGLGWTAHTFFM